MNQQWHVEDDLCDLSDRTPEIFNMGLADELALSSFDQGGTAHRISPSPAPHPNSESTDSKQDYSDPRAVARDVVAGKLLVSVVRLTSASEHHTQQPLARFRSTMTVPIDSMIDIGG